jgi:cytochrome c oxidase assembly protein subunit 15
MIALRTLRSPGAFARLCVVSLGLLWVIVPSGAVVRLSASGLGCPDWPLCDGGVVPESAAHAWIEYTNRALSAVVMLVAVATWLVARRLPGLPRAVGRWSAAAALTTAAQVPLGAVTVVSGLHPLAVGSHFLLSIVALACATLLAVGAIDWRDGRERGWDRRRGPLAGVVALGAAAVLSSGVVVSAAGPHSGDDDVTRRWGDLLTAVEVHVRIAIGFVLVAAVLFAWVAREGGIDRLSARAGALAVPLVALQIGIGEYQYRNGLPWGVVVAHVATGAAAWIAIVIACRGVARPAPYLRREAAVWQATQRTESGSTLSRPSGISPPQSTQIP